MVGVAYAAAARNPAPVPPSISPNVSSRFATDQLIIKMKDGSIPNVATLAAQAGESLQLKRKESNGAWVGKLGSRRNETDMQTLAAKIAALPGVAYAEPDAVMVPLAFTLRRRAPDPLVMLHPDTARARGIADGAWVEVASGNGTVRLRAKYERPKCC